MDILRLEVRGSEKIILSATVAASVFYWGWTLWKNRNEFGENQGSVRPNPIRSPGSPRTRDAFKHRGCTCHLIDTKDDCQKKKWTSSDEEETDTDANLIPSSMRSSKHVMLNR